LWLLALLPVIVLAAVLPLRSRTGVRVEPYGGPLPRLSVPVAYHITYAVTVPHARGYREELFVRRPFESVDEIITRGRRTLETVMRLGDQVIRTSGPATAVHTALAPTPRDVRIDPLAADAIRAGLLRVVGRARVLRTPCFVVRTAASLNSGPLRAFGAGTHVDSCVDARGLVLYEKTTRDGRTVMQRIATSVVTGAGVSTADFELAGEQIPPQQGGGGVRALTVDSRPSSGPFWDMPRGPAGYTHAGRYAVVPSQPQAWEDTSTFNALGVPGSLVASVDDVYLRGPDAIVVEQGSTVSDSTFTPPPGESVDLGPVLGRGQLLLSASASEIVAEPHEGRRFVRVIGTVPPEQLIAIARSMTLQPAGTMRPLSGAGS
jgi:hypothetical protein